MTTPDNGSHPDPVDPDFAALFRPDEIPSRPRQDEWTPDQEPLAAPVDDEPDQLDESDESDEPDEPHFEPILDPVVDPRDEDAAQGAVGDDDAPGAQARPEGAVAGGPSARSVADTGRLFRSRGVSGHGDTVLALTSDHFGRLRTLDRREDPEPAPITIRDAGPLPGADAAGDGPRLDAAGDAESRPRRGRRSPRLSHRSGRITGGAVYLVVIGVTVLVGFADALLTDGDIGWPTGLALLVSSTYAALTVRRDDDVLAFLVPPVAFLVTALTAAQLFLGSAEGSLLNRAVVVFFVLADNWYWIIGSTLVALVIVLARRRREVD